MIPIKAKLGWAVGVLLLAATPAMALDIHATNPITSSIQGMDIRSPLAGLL